MDYLHSIISNPALFNCYVNLFHSSQILNEELATVEPFNQDFVVTDFVAF